MQTAPAELRKSPKINDITISENVLSGVITSKSDLSVFRKIFELDDLESWKDIPPTRKAEIFLDKIKTIRLNKEVSVLEFAAEKGSLEIMNFILEQINAVDRTRIKEFVSDEFFKKSLGGDYPIGNNVRIKINFLMIAIKLQNHQAISSLVSVLVNDIDADSYRKCLQIAIENRDHNQLSLLLHSSILKRKEIENEVKPLHLLCNVPQDYAVLVERSSPGLNLNLPDADGNTPLHLAVLRKHKHTVGKIAQSADLNRKNKDGLTPIQIAAMQCDFETVKLLYHAGGDINSCFTLVQEQIAEESVDSDKDARTLLLKQLIHLLTLHNPRMKPKAGEAPKEKEDEDVKNLPPKMKYIYGCFKGGGGKGYAYLPAIKEAVKQGLIDLKQFKGFAGTSAGSITAALLALGLPIEKLEKITNKKNFTEFFDYYDEELVKTILSQVQGGVGIWTVLTNYWTIKGAKALMDKELGFCKGDNFYEWIKGVIKKSLEKIKVSIEKTPLGKKLENPEFITFKDLHDNPTFFKDLVVYGSNVNTGVSERYSFETTPDMCIADAIRISMSLPVIFSPHKKWIFNEKTQMRELAKRKDGSKDTDDCVDGGLFNNYPVGAFDYSETGEYKYNERNIGFCLAEPDEHEQFEFGASRKGASHEGSSIRFILSVVYSTMFNQQVVDHLKNNLDKIRTIYINTRDIGTTDFGLTPDQKIILEREAIEGVIRFIARQNKLPEKKLSSEVVKKLFSMGIIFSDKGVFRREGKKPITAARILKLYACAAEDELAYLKTIVNPNFLEDDVSALQIARAYGYKTILDRLQRCNANPDRPVLSVEEIKVKGLTDRLIDSKDESKLMKSKKTRLRDEIVSLCSEFKEDQSRLSEAHAQERQRIINDREKQLAEREEQSKASSDAHEQVKATLETHIQELEGQQTDLQNKMTYIVSRFAHEIKLREMIADFNKFKTQYTDVAYTQWGKGSGMAAAEKHWKHWRDICATEILQNFAGQCPVEEPKSKAEVIQAFCKSLRFLLAKLESEELRKIIEGSGTEPESYRSHVGRYRQQIAEQLQVIEQELATGAPAVISQSLPAVQRQQAFVVGAAAPTVSARAQQAFFQPTPPAPGLQTFVPVVQQVPEAAEQSPPQLQAQPEQASYSEWGQEPDFFADFSN